MLYMDINKAFAELQEQINNKINGYERKTTLLKEENEHLKSEHYENDEIQRLKKENEKLRDEMRRGFPITKEEDEAIDKWQQKHIKTKHGGNRYAGAIGGRFSYEFTPTGLGVLGICRCSCGDSFDFQELG